MEKLKNIDILKVIGILCIFLAHLSPGSIILQFRNFDVILMIIVSSFLFLKKDRSMNNKERVEYLWKRFKRLVIPTWIFLCIYFAIMYFVNTEGVSLEIIKNSFLLFNDNSIGYVWIIRIYLMVAVILPITQSLLKKPRINIYILVIYIIYEVLCYFNIFSLNIILKDYIAYIVPIVLIIGVTYWIMKSSSKKVVAFSIINLFVFLVIAIVTYYKTGELSTTNVAKYPFRIYYLSYAFFASGILIVIFRNKKITDFIYNNVFKTISEYSLWIYFWHILCLYFIEKYIAGNWILKYILVIISSLVLIYIQKCIITKLEKTRINKELLKIFKG